MAFNKKGQQKSEKEGASNGNAMSNNSNNSGKNELEVRPQKSLTFNPAKQSSPIFTSGSQQLNSNPKQSSEQDQQKELKIDKINASHENGRYQVLLTPNDINKNTISSPRHDEINFFINKQGQTQNNYQNSIYDVTSNQKYKKNVKETENNVGDEVDTKQTKQHLIKYNSIDINKLIENNAIQNSQVNVVMNNNQFSTGAIGQANGIFQSNMLENYSQYNINSATQKSLKASKLDKPKVDNMGIEAKYQFNNEVDNQASLDYSNRLQNFQNMKDNNNNLNIQNNGIDLDSKQNSYYIKRENLNTYQRDLNNEIDLQSNLHLRSPRNDVQQTNNQENSPNQKGSEIQQPSNLSSKQKDNNGLSKLKSETEGGGIDMNNASVQRTGEISLHLHRLIKGKNPQIFQEIIKIIFLQVLGIIVEALQIVRRYICGTNQLFFTLAPLTIAVEIIAIIPILCYQHNLNSQISQSHTKKIFFFGISQILRSVVFLNTFITHNKSTSSLEAIVELFFIQLLSRQVFPNFKVFRIKEKLQLFEQIIFIIGGICLLDYDSNNLYFQFIQWGLIIFISLLIQFYFGDFPYNIGFCNLYNAQNENYFQMKRSYYSQRIFESQFNDQAGLIPATSKINNQNNINNNIISGGRVNNGITSATSQTPNEMWRLQHKSQQNVNNTQYIDASNKHEAKNMLTDSVQYVFLSDKAQTLYASKKMIPQIATFFAKKEKSSLIGVSQLGEYVASPSDFTTIPQQKSTSSFSPNNLIKMFDQFLEKVIIERVDFETMTLWENLKKTSGRPSYVIPSQIQDSTSQFLSQKQRFFQENNHSQHITQQPLQISQLNPIPGQSNPSTFRELIQMRNSFINYNKVSASAITTNNIGFSSKIGLKSKYMMISLKEFLIKLSSNWAYFKKHYVNKPIVVAQFTTDDLGLDISEIKKYQIKVYPQTNKREFVGDDIIDSPENTVQSVVGMTTSKKFIQENDQEQKECPTNFLLVFEEVHSREKIVNKSQFYQFLKSLFRCFNNDLTQSLSNILGTSQAGIQSSKVNEEVKDRFIRPILLSCRIIKYILHNLRDFNDLVGERFQLHIVETSIPKVAEDSVILFKATSDKQISFKVVINSEVPIVVLTDQRRLVQIIITLLSNAHKHTQAGSLTFRIFHPYKGGLLQKNLLRFQVEDTGEGMDSSIQQRLAKLFNSGIGYQDFKSISTFGFNLFICNIIAKKLYNPDYQYSLVKEKEYLTEVNNDISGIKFKSTPNKGSVFFFDIKLIEEKKADKLQDSVFNYVQGANLVPTISEVNSIKNNPSLKDHIFITSSQPSMPTGLNVLQTQENINNPHSKFQTRHNSRKSTYNTQVDGLEIADETTKQDNNKNETRIMQFQKQPKGLHSDYKFLKCKCKNILIVDKVLRNLESIEILLTNSNFQPQKCCSIKEAINLCQEKNIKKCSTCNQVSFICIFIFIDEYQKQDMSAFVKEFESFSNSQYCKDSIVIAVGNMTSKTKKILENVRIDEFLSNPFDVYEFYNLVNNWRLLPISESYSSTLNVIQSLS